MSTEPPPPSAVAAATAYPQLCARVADEVRSFHADLVRWFTGRDCADSDEAYASLVDARLSDALVYVMPGGETFSKQRLRAAMRAAHGSNREFAIDVSDIAVHVVDTHTLLVGYEEQQHGARQSASSNRRKTSALLEHGGDAQPDAPLRWRIIHETWLPNGCDDNGGKRDDDDGGHGPGDGDATAERTS